MKDKDKIIAYDLIQGQERAKLDYQINRKNIDKIEEFKEILSKGGFNESGISDLLFASILTLCAIALFSMGFVAFIGG